MDPRTGERVQLLIYNACGWHAMRYGNEQETQSQPPAGNINTPLQQCGYDVQLECICLMHSAALVSFNLLIPFVLEMDICHLPPFIFVLVSFNHVLLSRLFLGRDLCLLPPLFAVAQCPPLENGWGPWL
eukprot:15008669-Ditylum_brightwellii.AAC.1